MFLFLEGSGQSPAVFYSVATGISEEAAKDVADAIVRNFVRLPSQSPWKPRITDRVWGGKPGGRVSCSLLGCIVFPQRERERESLGERRDNLKSIANRRVSGTGRPGGTLLMQSPTATDLHFNDNWLLSKSWTRGLHFLTWSLLTWTTRWPHLPLRIYFMSSWLLSQYIYIY